MNLIGQFFLVYSSGGDDQIRRNCTRISLTKNLHDGYLPTWTLNVDQ